MEVQKHRMLLAVIEQLQKCGSWTGKTHVQKTLFLLKAVETTNVPFNFVLYKHGPYSFEVEAELEEMRSYAAISSLPMADGYGVVLIPAENADWLKRQADLSLEQSQGISKVCEFVGSKNVTQLERLATAAWIRKQEKVQDSQAVATRLHELKPHISVEDALKADAELSSMQ
jgi:uncharacterized protein YwgA